MQVRLTPVQWLLGLALIVPDTSPRGPGVPGDPAAAYDFGIGAGFYLDATVAPFAEHYRMESYLTRELQIALPQRFPIDVQRQSVMGHSMGGHGAITLALRHPRLFSSVSAFAPISSLTNCSWGQKALRGYLGADPTAWRGHDATLLMADGHRIKHLLVDQGTSDSFIATQLRPDLLAAACAEARIDLSLRYRDGYDHSYYFIASYVEEHLEWHAHHLGCDELVVR